MNPNSFSGPHHTRPVVSCLQQGVDPSQRVLAAPIRSEPVALRREVPLENRLQHCPERRLHHPVAHRRNPQGALFFAPQFADPVAPNRLRADSFLPAATVPTFPGSLPSVARTRSPSHDPRPPLLGWPSRERRLAADSAGRRPCPSGCTTYLSSLPLRESSTSVPSKPRLRPRPIEPESLRRE